MDEQQESEWVDQFTALFEETVRLRLMSDVPLGVFLSGGLDSTTLLLHLLAKKEEVHAISFNYGQKHKIELEKAKLNIKYLNLYGYNINLKV